MDILRCTIVLRDNIDEGLGTIILSDVDNKNGVACVHIKMDKEKGRGKGYGTDALKAIIRYTFNEMRLNCICANVLEQNVLSQRLFEKCGFVKEGILRSRVYKNGHFINMISYSILKNDLSETDLEGN